MSSGGNNLEGSPAGMQPPRPPGGWGEGGESTAGLLCATYNNIGAIYHNLGDDSQSRSYLQLAVQTMMDHVVFITTSMQERRQQIIDNAEYPQEDRHSRLAIAYGEAVALEQALLSRHIIGTDITTGLSGDGMGSGGGAAYESGSSRPNTRGDGSSSTATDATICSPIFINKETMRLSSPVDIYRNSSTILFNMAISFMHSLVSAEREEYANRTHRELKRAWERAQLFFNLSIEALNTGVSEVREDEQRRRRQAQEAQQDAAGGGGGADVESALFRFHMCRDSILRVLITHQQKNLEQMKDRYLRIASQPSTQGPNRPTTSS